MSEQRRFGESDHEPLAQDDVLRQAIGEWRDELPSRDLWSGVQARIGSTQSSATPATSLTASRRVIFTLPQLAMAATLLMAVASGLTWMVARPPAVPNSNEPVIQAYGVPEEETEGKIVQANFADAQFNAAVTDLEQILRDERD